MRQRNPKQLISIVILFVLSLGRIEAREAWRFDSNAFTLNWTHALSGGSYHNLVNRRKHRSSGMEFRPVHVRYPLFQAEHLTATQAGNAACRDSLLAWDLRMSWSVAELPMSLDLHMSRQPRQGSLAGTSASETRHLMSAGLSVRL